MRDLEQLQICAPVPFLRRRHAQAAIIYFGRSRHAFQATDYRDDCNSLRRGRLHAAREDNRATLVLSVSAAPASQDAATIGTGARRADTAERAEYAGYFLSSAWRASRRRNMLHHTCRRDE